MNTLLTILEYIVLFAAVVATILAIIHSIRDYNRNRNNWTDFTGGAGASA